MCMKCKAVVGTLPVPMDSLELVNYSSTYMDGVIEVILL